MKYQFIENANIEEMNEFVVNSPMNSFLQMYEWADVKDNWGHLFCAVKDENGKMVASILILTRSAPFGYKMMYIPRGPIMDYQNEELVTFVINRLKEIGKREKAFVIRFDPNVLHNRYLFEEKDKEHIPQNEDVLERLKKLGALHKGFTMRVDESTQPRFVAAMDVDENYHDRLIRKTRQSLRTTEKKGTEYK